jgi:signal transduction histidine kinase
MGVLLREIQFSIKTLDELINEKQDMIGLMSHDLKNPLAAVMTYSELIPSADTDEKKIKLRDKIIDAAKVQRSIINSVLELLEREEIIITEDMMEVVDAQTLFDETKATYEGELNAKNLTLETVGNGKKIKANRDLLSQVLTNLISNAVKFTPNGGSISITANNKDNNTVIKVVDTGIGFNPEKSELIFERFTKEKRKGTEGENTTGLGLYLCEKIVCRHNGTITATSEGKDKGSTFEITLPAVK